MAEYKDLVQRRKELERLLNQVKAPESMDLQQMLKGVKGDKLRDEKRRLYQENQTAIGQAEERRGKILEQLGKLDGQIAAEDPERQNERFNRTMGSMGAGAAVATGMTGVQDRRFRAQDRAKLTDSNRLARSIRDIDPDAPDAQSRYKAAHSTAKRKGFYSPRRGLGTLTPGLTMLASGAFGRFGVAPNVEEESARDAVTDVGAATMTAGTGQMLGQSALNRSAPDSVSASSMQAFEEARERARGGPRPPGTPPPGSLPPGVPDNALSRAAPPPPGPPPGTPPAAPPQPLTNSERLLRAAREAGATGKMTKAQAAQYLAGNVTAKNRAAVASELGVKPGPNFATRLSVKVRDMATTTRRLPGVALPIVAGTMAYDAASSSAEARGAGPVERTATGAGAGTAVGGAVYGAGKLAQLPPVQRAISRVVPPVAAYGLARDAVDEATYAGPEDPVGGFESPFGRQVMSEYDAPQNALSAVDPGSSDFGQALDAFMQFVTQEMAEQGQGQGQGGGETMQAPRRPQYSSPYLGSQ